MRHQSSSLLSAAAAVAGGVLIVWVLGTEVAAAVGAAALLTALAARVAQRRYGSTPAKTPQPCQLPVPPARLSPRQDWTPEERSGVAAVLQALERDGVAAPPEELLLQIAWSRGLRPEDSAALWRQHMEAASRLDIAGIGDEAVREAYGMGFCERCGEDVDGRPMIWVRMALCEVAKLTPSLAVKNTWLAQDATLCGSAEANRRGICFVYDLRGVGFRNVTFDPRYLRAAISGATSHPMHVSRVWMLDAPGVFLAAWRAGKVFLPQHVREVVRFHSTGARDSPACLAPVCAPEQLPPYLGGDADRFGDSYAEWMLDRLRGQPLAYAP